MVLIMPQAFARITISFIEIPYCFLILSNSKAESLLRCAPNSALIVSSGSNMAPEN